MLDAGRPPSRVLCLRGLSTGDFKEALGALLEDRASGLSASSIMWMTSAFGERRMYGGRIELVKRWSGLRPSTRRTPPSTIPAPVVTCRGRARPFRTTSARRSSSRSARCLSTYSETSASKASSSIRRAPSRKARPEATPLAGVASVKSVAAILRDGAVQRLRCLRPDHTALFRA